MTMAWDTLFSYLKVVADTAYSTGAVRAKRSTAIQQAGEGG